MEKWKVVAIEPGKEPYETEMSFENAQEFVGGYIRQVHVYDDIVALVNEDGERHNLEPNRHMILQEKGHIPLLILGNFILVKVADSDFKSLNEKEIEEAKFIYRSTSKDATIFI